MSTISWKALNYVQRTRLLKYMRKIGVNVPGTLSLSEINKIMQDFLNNLNFIDVHDYIDSLPI